MDAHPLVLHLLDGSQTIPVQTWKLGDKATIRIGRADDNDVIVHQPMVSRQHAVLNWDGADWTLANISRMGTLVEGVAISQARISPGDAFQLGPAGPFLRMQSQHVPASNAMGTITLGSLVPHEIDSEQAAAQVDAITKTDYFRNLQQLARQLKSNSSSEP